MPSGPPSACPDSDTALPPRSWGRRRAVSARSAHVDRERGGVGLEEAHEGLGFGRELGAERAGERLERRDLQASGGALAGEEPAGADEAVDEDRARAAAVA